MAKATFNRTKPHVNVGTIGHVDRSAETLSRLNSRDSCGQRRLAVVDVADGADVDVRLGAVE